MSSFSKNVLAEIDLLIKNERVVDIFSLSLNIENSNGIVEPIHSTIDGESLVLLLRIKPDLESDSYINLYTGDGGAFIYRSDDTDEFEELLFDT
jgi:hypothetical protein